MPRLERTALVPFAAEAVCAVVNDVERYPEFLRWCTAAEAVAGEGDEITASLTLKGLGRTESLVTRNRVEDGRRIVLKLVEGAVPAAAGRLDIHAGGAWLPHPLGP